MNRAYDPLNCPHCGKLNDRHTCPLEPGAQPSEGDITICIHCGKWAIFDQNSFRLPTMDEWAFILKDNECQRLERAWKRMREQIGTN